MKTFDKASIIAITFGCYYLIYNLYMLISSNPIFVENAKPEVVRAERERLADAQPIIEKLEAALLRITEK